MPHHYFVPGAAKIHILVGDLRGGGHQAGCGRGKSEFPPSWTATDILTHIADVANDPASMATNAHLGRLKIVGLRKGVTVTVIVNPRNGAIITGYPA